MLRLAASIGVGAVVPKLFGKPWYTSFLSAFLMYIITGGWKTIDMLWNCFPRDLHLVINAIKVERFIKKMEKNKKIVADYLVENSKKFPSKPAYISVDSGEIMTFKEANELSNRIANYFYENGFRKGDIVALMMENRNEYFPVWLGLSKIGVITALINTNLRGESLQHCIEVAESVGFIYTKKYADAISSIKLNIKESFCYDNEVDGSKSLCEKIADSSVEEPVRQELSVLDKLIYIYTSGTTGLPKAAVIRGSRFTYMGYGMGCLDDFEHDDIFYNTLPLYHSNGGVAMVGGSLFFGMTFVSREKFSASRFFEDCNRYNCTIFNYIGETCRYLLAQPIRDVDKKHRIRFGAGNGLRKSIWREFQERFNVPVMKEFYGATEGNAGMVNTVGHVGAVGFIPPLFSRILPTRVVLVDKDTGEIVRDKNGVAMEAKPGEPGELVGKIENRPLKQYDGYVNQAASKKKIGYDIFCKGDKAFMSGDVLTYDKYGFFYFQDRTGDTFRWKGENVSTNEVEGVISKSLHLNDVCVYGVEINGIEGRAGMACIVDPERTVDVNHLYDSVSKILPAYARPIFLRFTKEIAKTGTYKFQKTKLRKESFDPTSSEDDKFFYLDPVEKKYTELTTEIYNNIQSGNVRF